MKAPRLKIEQVIKVFGEVHLDKNLFEVFLNFNQKSSELLVHILFQHTNRTHLLLGTHFRAY
jgi:hypothetical protein